MPLNHPLSPEEILTGLIAEQRTAEITQLLSSLESGELVRVTARLSDEARERLLDLLAPRQAADVLEHLPEAQALDALEGLAPKVAARILEELPSNEQADLVGELSQGEADAILAELRPEEAKGIRRLASYRDEVAGGLMITEFLSFGEFETVSSVIDDIRESSEEYAAYDIQYAYVVRGENVLCGVVPLRDLLLAKKSTPIVDLMIRNPISVVDSTPLRILEDLFDEHHFFGIPVVSESGEMLGVVRRAAVQEALAERSEEDYRRAQGLIAGEELRSMPLRIRSMRRLSWLSINVVLNLIAASVIAMYQDTLSQVIALAVFLPIISDMSGCSGNQAVAVSMRELALGVTRPSDLFHVVSKELSVGLINGLCLGLLLGGVTYLWQGNGYLGVVVGGALWINTAVAVVVGGGTPLLLRKFQFDPALASGPILTTITDMVGFFLALSMATLMLAYLV